MEQELVLTLLCLHDYFAGTVDIGNPHGDSRSGERDTGRLFMKRQWKKSNREIAGVGEMERYGHRESFLLSGVKFSNNKPSHPLFLSILTSAMKMLQQVHPIHPPAQGFTCFLQEFAHHPGCDRCHLTRLGNHGISTCNGRSYFPGQQIKWQIPRAD